MTSITKECDYKEEKQQREKAPKVAPAGHKERGEEERHTSPSLGGRVDTQGGK